MYNDAKNSSLPAQNVKRTGYGSIMTSWNNGTILYLDLFTYPTVIQSHDGIGWKIRHLVGGLTMKEGHVHLHPVTADIQGNQHLPHEEPLGVEKTEHDDETGCGTSVGHHIKDGSKSGA